MQVEVYVPIMVKIFEFEDGLSKEELERKIENKISFYYRNLNEKEGVKRCVK